MRLRRLRRMRREELSWRTRALARTQRDRVAASLYPPVWDRKSLLYALAPDVLAPSMVEHLARADWPAAERHLRARITGREPRFVLDPGLAGGVRASVLARWPDAARAAAERADRILDGRWDLLGYRDLPVFEDERPLDWHFDPVHRRRAPGGFWADVDYLNPASGDHKVIWEINRHQHWLALGRAYWLTGDDRYAAALTDQLPSWLEANPPLAGINWASMLEIGLRSISWVWALHFLLAPSREPAAAAPDRAPWLLDLLMGIDRQLTHVEQNLSYYFSPNTHLTGEALSLYVVGRSLPELRRSSRWAKIGRDVLLREIDRQIASDGGHVERSLHYHRYTLDFYLLALLVAERTGDDRARAALRPAVARLAHFARGIADSNGRLATIGDDDGGMLWPLTGRDVTDIRDSLALAAALLDEPALAPWGPQEELAWLGSTLHQPRPREDAGSSLPRPNRGDLRPRLFPETGYAVIEDGAGSHAIFDVGGHGFLNGGHAHADALALTLTLQGRPLLIDPGTGTYTMDAALRDRLREGASHNTVIVDGRSPSEPNGPFHWRTTTDATLLSWRANNAFAWAEGSHHGYGAIAHRRHVIYLPGGSWLVVDELSGEPCAHADVHWHFDPAWQLACEDGHLLKATDAGGAVAWLLHDGGALQLARGDRETGRGWAAPCYGRLVPAWSAHFSHAAPRDPLVTWIGPGGAGKPRMDRLSLDHDGPAPALGVRVQNGPSCTVVMLQPGHAPVRNDGASEAAWFGTDARLLHYSGLGGRLETLSIADGTYAWPVGDGALGVLSDEPVTDLHVRTTPEAIELSASVPPARLRLQGSAVGAVRVLTLNGRIARPTRDTRQDALVISGADWGAPLPEAQTCVA